LKSQKLTSRANDFTFCLLMAYVVLTSLSPTPGPRASLVLHFAHALIWRVFHSYGLGLLLRAQSKSKWLVRHFLKHYHYPIEVNGTESEQREGVVKRATEEAFGNWQVAYNVSLVMTYSELFHSPRADILVSFGLLAWKTYSLPSDWTVSGTILRHTLGLVHL
jgi:phosphatidylethanolamine N-methyltransferase